MNHIILTFLYTRNVTHRTYYRAYTINDFFKLYGDKAKDFQLVTPDHRHPILLNDDARKAYDSIAPDAYTGEVKNPVCGVFKSSATKKIVAFDTRSGLLETHECNNEHSGVVWLYKNTPGVRNYE